MKRSQRDMNKPKPIDTLLNRVSSMQNSTPGVTRRCSRELRDLLATSPTPTPMMASASMPALHRTRSVTKRSSSSSRLARRTYSSKWPSDDRVKYRSRRRSSGTLPGPNAEFDTFDDSARKPTTSAASLLFDKVERAIICSSPEETPKQDTPPKTAKKSAAESTPTTRTTPRTTTRTTPPPARNNIPADASSISQQQQSSSHRRNKERRVAKANIKYNNEAGRAAVLAVCETLHHDFGQLNNIINVTLPADELDALAENPDVAWIDRSGAVFFMQPYRSSK